MLTMIKTLLNRWLWWIVGGVILFLLGTNLTLFLLLDNANSTLEERNAAYTKLSETLSVCSSNNEEYRTEIDYLNNVILIMKDSNENIEEQYDGIKDKWESLNKKNCLNVSENKGNTNEKRDVDIPVVDYTEHFRLLREAACGAGADCL